MLFHAVKVKDVKVRIGQLVRSLRKRDNLSQEQLAAILNLSRLTVQNLEKGQNPTLDTLLKVFQHFDLLEKFNATIGDYIQDNQYKSLY